MFSYLSNNLLIDDIEHPNKNKYPSQRMMVFEIKNYIYLVPYTETENEVFLKTIIPSRKATKSILEGKMDNKINKEEQEILDSFERGEWKSVPDLKERKNELNEYAAATLRKSKRLNIRISERDLRELQRKAVSEGLPYQTYVSSILHKFVNGNLVEKSST